MRRYAERRERTAGRCTACGQPIVKVTGNWRVVRVLDGEDYVGETWFECPCGFSNESVGAEI
jgi:hypothetical protein